MSFLSTHPGLGYPKYQKPSPTSNLDGFTPTRSIIATEHVLGDIDLDPASRTAANLTIQATRFFTEADNGLTQQWHTRSVWLNPPYDRINGKSGQTHFSQKPLAEYHVGHVKTAILLIDAVTDRKWFRPLWNYPICFTDHQITFVSPIPDQAKQRTHGSAFVYFSPNGQYFNDVFGIFEHIVGGAAW